MWSLLDLARVAGRFSLSWWGAATEPKSGHLV